MSTVITASAGMQRWVDDAAEFPRAVPARLRMLLDTGLVQEAGGTYFERPSAELLERMSAAELEERAFATGNVWRRVS